MCGSALHLHQYIQLVPYTKTFNNAFGVVIGGKGELQGWVKVQHLQSAPQLGEDL